MAKAKDVQNLSEAATGRELFLEEETKELAREAAKEFVAKFEESALWEKTDESLPSNEHSDEATDKELFPEGAASEAKLFPKEEEEATGGSSSKEEAEEAPPAPEGSLQQVLEKVVGKAARSNKNGFKVTDKLEEIQRILEEAKSPYHLVAKSDNAWIFGKKEMSDGQSVLMVSSHADIVDRIKNPHSKLFSDKDYYRGTYDNAGTNAVCTHLMATENLPEDVYFSFTAEEETGKCLGAADTISYVREVTGKEPIVLALDVTDEGYENNRLFTVEGLHGVNEDSRRKMLEVFLSTEGEEQSFEVVKLRKKDDNSFLPESYQGEGLTVFDESVFYAENGCNSCSICLPGDGEMHGDSGFKVKRAVMEGYEASLLAIVYAFKEKDNELNFMEKMEELKARKNVLVKEAKDTGFWKEQYFTNSYSGGTQYYSGRSYSAWDSSFYDEYGERRMLDPYEEEYILDQAVADAYEIAASYADDEFEVFYTDMVGMYGFKQDAESRAIFEEIFEECQESERYFEEEFSADDYGIEMD